MSHFGDHTLRQDILDWVEYAVSEHNVSTYELIKAMLDVLISIIETAEYEERGAA